MYVLSGFWCQVSSKAKIDKILTGTGIWGFCLFVGRSRLSCSRSRVVVVVQPPCMQNHSKLSNLEGVDRIRCWISQCIIAYCLGAGGGAPLPENIYKII